MPHSVASLDTLSDFEFFQRSFDPDSGLLTLSWRWHHLDDAIPPVEFRETFVFPEALRCSPDRQRSLDAAFDLLHWIAGVSYWKIRCSGSVRFNGSAPDSWQAQQLEQVYQQGLAELAWRNHLINEQYWPRFSDVAGASNVLPSPPPQSTPDDRVLVALGGGKDSLVALERVRRAGIQPHTIQIGPSRRIQQTAEAACLQHWVVERTLAPQLKPFNDAGAINGHVPITAINSATLLVAAILSDFGAVVFANERSSDEPTLVYQGQPINHQFAKSHAFEVTLNQWIKQYISKDIEVFSLLRRDTELAICREFAGLKRYHPVFSSCNRNFHVDGPRTDRWCGHCPKCLFVYLALAPFMQPAELRTIFARDLLDDPTLIEGFSQLLELDGHRPFECVGSAAEARAAVQLLHASDAWCAHPVVRALHDRMIECGAELDGAQLDALMQPAGPDCIPARMLA